MKILNVGAVIVLALSISACTMFKQKQQPQGQTAVNQNAQVQTENRDQEAFERAASLTNGWPGSSMNAAKEMISKYGEPQEITSDSLIWRNIAPFKRVIVHREVYSARFPLLHQNSLEHVVDYKAPVEKIDDIWRYNGSIVLNRTKGEMSSFADNEAMNFLSLNLAHKVLSGAMSADAARITFGKETIKYFNGERTANTSVLVFGGQFQTADQGESVANKIRWIGDPANQKRTPAQKLNTRQAQEER